MTARQFEVINPFVIQNKKYNDVEKYLGFGSNKTLEIIAG